MQDLVQIGIVHSDRFGSIERDPISECQDLLGDPICDLYLALGVADDDADRESVQAGAGMGEIELQPVQLMGQLQRAPQMRQQNIEFGGFTRAEM